MPGEGPNGLPAAIKPTSGRCLMKVSRFTARSLTPDHFEMQPELVRIGNGLFGFSWKSFDFYEVIQFLFRKRSQQHFPYAATVFQDSNYLATAPPSMLNA
jgi:hypothetical protein